MERVSSCSCSMTMPRSLAGSDRRRKRPRCPPPDPVKRDAVDAKSNIRSGNVPALGPADYVLLRVLRHHEDRPEDDHDEDRQQDEIHEFREVARAAREDRAVEAARPGDEAAAGQGPG